MSCTFTGLLTLSLASSYPMLLLAAALVGVGSAVFHPESSRVARMASGGQHGLAQSIFQVGGNAGASLGPLLAALLALLLLIMVGNWYKSKSRGKKPNASAPLTGSGIPVSRSKVAISIA